AHCREAGNSRHSLPQNAREPAVTRTRPIVAVVDDDPRLLESLADPLESAGYAARCFPSARALLADRFSDLDVLITDIGMPGMDGFELRDLMQKECPEMPVFL